MKKLSSSIGTVLYKKILLNDGSLILSKIFGYKKFYKFEIHNSDSDNKSLIKNEKSKI